MNKYQQCSETIFFEKISIPVQNDEKSVEIKILMESYQKYQTIFTNYLETYHPKCSNPGNFTDGIKGLIKEIKDPF
jgi:hypothetical protein